MSKINYIIKYTDGKNEVELKIISSSLIKAVMEGYDKLIKEKPNGVDFQYTGEYKIKEKINLRKSNGIALITPNGEFSSIKDAARHHGLSLSFVSSQMKRRNLNGWIYKDEEAAPAKIIDPKIKTVVITPNGKFNSVLEAGRAHGMTRPVVYDLLRRDKLKDWKIKKIAVKGK